LSFLLGVTLLIKRRQIGPQIIEFHALDTGKHQVGARRFGANADIFLAGVLFQVMPELLFGFV
jgi:hypothetical protein